MGRRKELSGFSDLELIYELRDRGLAVTAYDCNDLEDVGVPENRRKKAFDRIRVDLEDRMSKSANEFLDSEFRGYLDKMLKKIGKE
jgi:hypothetical protein